MISLLPPSLLQTNDMQILKEKAKALGVRVKCEGQTDLTCSLGRSEMLFERLVSSESGLNSAAPSLKRKTGERPFLPRAALGRESSLDQWSGELRSELRLYCSCLFVPRFPSRKIKLIPALSFRRDCGKDQRMLNSEKRSQR